MSGHLEVVERAADAILEYERWRAARLRRARRENGRQKYRTAAKRKFPGPTCEEVLDEVAGRTPRLWCRLAERANLLARVRKEGEAA